MLVTMSMMLEGRTYRAYLDPGQEAKATQYAAVARCCYNLAREQRELAYRLTGRSPGYGAQCRDITELRGAEPWIREAPVHICQQAVRDCDTAYRRFFEGKARYPRWRRKGVNESFRYPDPKQIEVAKISRRWWKIKLPKLGWVRFRWTRPIGGIIKNVTVSRDRAGDWTISICVDTERQPAPIAGAKGPVGVDRGIARPYQSSDDQDDWVDIPGLKPKEAERLRRLERS